MVYYFYGEDWLRTKQAIEELQRTLPDRQYMFFNLEDDFSGFTGFVSQLSSSATLFGQRYFLVGKAQKFAKEQKDFLKKALPYFMKSQPGQADGDSLLIWEVAAKPTLDFLKKGEEIKQEVFAFLKGAQLKKWLKEYAAKQDLTVGDEVLETLILLFGNQTDFLTQELNKISLFQAGLPLPPGKKFSQAELDKLVVGYFEANFFSWIQAALEKKADKLILETGTADGTLLANLSGLLNALRALIIYKSPAPVGGHNQTLLATGISPFWLKSITSWAQARNLAELENLFSQLLDLDLMIRSGKLESEQGEQSSQYNSFYHHVPLS